MLISLTIFEFSLVHWLMAVFRRKDGSIRILLSLKPSASQWKYSIAKESLITCPSPVTKVGVDITGGVVTISPCLQSSDQKSGLMLIYKTIKVVCYTIFQ